MNVVNITTIGDIMKNYNEPAATKTTEKNLSNEIKTMAEKSSAFVSHVKDEASTVAKSGKDYLKETAKKDSQALKDYVIAHPGKSVGYAVAAGFILSKILGRSKR